MTTGEIIDFNTAMLTHRDRPQASPIVTDPELRRSIEAVLPALLEPALDAMVELNVTQVDWEDYTVNYRSIGLPSDSPSEDFRFSINLRVIDFFPEDGIFKGGQEIVGLYRLDDEDSVVDVRLDLKLTEADREHLDALIAAIAEPSRKFRRVPLGTPGHVIQQVLGEIVARLRDELTQIEMSVLHTVIEDYSEAVAEAV